MARNKYPEETVKLILDVATLLFVEKDLTQHLCRTSSMKQIFQKAQSTITFRPKKKFFEAIFHRIGEENTNALATRYLRVSVLEWVGKAAGDL